MPSITRRTRRYVLRTYNNNNICVCVNNNNNGEIDSNHRTIVGPRDDGGGDRAFRTDSRGQGRY